MKLKKFCMVLALLCMISASYHPVYAKDNESVVAVNDWNENREDGEYQFPVDTSDTEVWESLDSHEEMLDTCNIPDEVLKKMSTEELLNLVLEYPLLIDITAYDSWNDGLEALAEDFNGIRELLNREDGAEQLLDAYCECEISDDEKKTDFTQVLDVEFIEAALAQEDVLEQLDEEQLEQLSDEVEEKYEDKSNNEMYKTFEGSMYENMYENETLDLIDATCVLEDSGTSELCSRQIVIYTKKGKPVPAYLQDESLSAQQIKNINKKYKKAYPKATFVSGSTSKYNCHSYAWYKTSTKNSYWINSPATFIKEAKLIGKKPTKKGQKAVWINAASKSYYEHSGIVYSYSSGSSFLIQSKWGKAPLMRHKANYSPYGGTVKYYEY